jgi:phosphohistidine phosphatase
MRKRIHHNPGQMQGLRPDEQTGVMPSPRRLILLRHAKSSWEDTSVPDDQRPLAPRGRRALVVVGQHLRASDIDVDLVLCSPARRTRETWDGLGLHGEPEVRFVREIYEATAHQLLELVNQVDDRYRTVLLIGHNPGMEDLAAGLLSDGNDESLSQLHEGFATAALAVLSCDHDWSDLTWRSARLDSYVRPRDLSGG